MQVFTINNMIKKAISLVASFGIMSAFALTCSAYTFENGHTEAIDADGMVVFPDGYFESNPEKAKVCEQIWGQLKKHGVGDEMCAAMCANIACECGFNPCASEFIIDDDNGRGIFMYTPSPPSSFGTGCHHDLEVFCAGKTDHRHGTGTDCSVHHELWEDGEFTWQHCIPCQIEFFFQDPSHGGKVLPGIERTMVVCPEGVTTATDLCKYDFLSACGGDVDKAIKLATEDFCFYCEVPSMAGSHIGGRVKNAKIIYEKFKGTGTSSGSTDDTDESGMPTKDGYLAEDEFVPNKSLKETAIILPDHFVDRVDAVEAMNWRKDIEGKQEMHKYDTIRGIVMFAGIILCVYSILLYVAYMFDTVNNLIDIDLLSVLTLGHLRAADGEKETSAGGSSGATSVVTHTQMLKYTCIGVGIGCLIVSGGMYNVILWVFNFVTKHILHR